MPVIRYRAFQNLLIKILSRSEMILSGSPFSQVLPVIEKEVYDFGRGHVHAIWDETDVCSQSDGDRYDAVVALFQRNLWADEIYRNRIATVIRDGKGM